MTSKRVEEFQRREVDESMEKQCCSGGSKKRWSGRTAGKSEEVRKTEIRA
jgi:hypothetical protein